VVKDGAERGTSCKDVAARTEIVITVPPDGPEVEQAVLGPDRVLEGGHRRLILVDISSIGRLGSHTVGAACAQKGVGSLDAPVKRDEPKAIDGTLAIMAGGDKATFDKVAPMLQLK
jgi:2-hydroxy-3-oxopropionate reductase